MLWILEWLTTYMRTRMLAFSIASWIGPRTKTIAYSEDCTLEGAGSEDFFRIWDLVEAEAY